MIESGSQRPDVAQTFELFRGDIADLRRTNEVEDRSSEDIAPRRRIQE